MKIHFSAKHLLATLFLFMVEVAIAHFRFNPFIRGFLGDVLVILLLYSFIKIFIKNNSFKISISVLAFAFLVELLQFFKITEILNVQSKLLLTVLGAVFDPLDLVAYSLGFVIILIIEGYFHKKGCRFLKS